MKRLFSVLILALSTAALLSACGGGGGGGGGATSGSSQLDTTFNTTGKVTTLIGTGPDGASAVAIQSDGKIVAVGYAYNGSQYVFALVRYNTNGSLDTTFNTTGMVTTPIGTHQDQAFAVAIQSDGKIVVAGATNNGSQNAFALVRYNTDGSLNTTFNTTGKVTTPIGTSDCVASAVTIQSDGKIVAAGMPITAATMILHLYGTTPMAVWIRPSILQA